MPQAVTIRSLPKAFELVKAMQAQGLEWGEGYRGLGRQAIAAILAGQMGRAIDAKTLPQARPAAAASPTAGERTIPKVVLRNDLDELLTCWTNP